MIAGIPRKRPRLNLAVAQGQHDSLVASCRCLATLFWQEAAWSFTHFPMDPEHQAALRQAAAKGLVVNASTESRSAAAALVRQGLPAVCVVPPDAPAVFRHEGGLFVACPASRRGRCGRKVQCISCGSRFGLPLCAQADRPFVITFPAHGPRAAVAAAHCS
ncbi:MAG: hypothetical protein VKI42_10315 [Synechococcaceae cyanobacterium]|nr:hypothetical protein [Synechococcaceae cyanobacterium]